MTRRSFARPTISRPSGRRAPRHWREASRELDASPRPSAKAAARALKLLDEAIRLAPDEPAFRKLRDRAIRAAGRPAEAREASKAARP